MITESFTTRRYLALFLPFLSAERAMRTGDAPPDSVFALADKVRGAVRLIAVSPQAQKIGIVPGLSLADARAQLPDFAVVRHDPDADRIILEALADDCDRYSPAIAVDPVRALVLDITGCTHVFKGEAGLAADIVERLGRRGFNAVFGLADTPDAALALAEFGRDVDGVDDLPIAALRIDAANHLALRRAGLTTIGDLSRRPRAAFASRFGMRTTVLLARILGEEDVRITPRRTPPALQVVKHFVEPVVRVEFVLGALDRLMTEASTLLTRRGAGGRKFEAAFFRSDGAIARLTVETNLPTRDPKIIARLFRERIDTLADPLDPGFGFDLVRLAVPVLEPLAEQQLSLEGSSATGTEIATLIDRLKARLGPDRVRRLHCGNSHIPEQASFDRSIADTSLPNMWPEAETGLPPSRPPHLFSPPQRIDVMAEVPEGPPRWFQWHGTRHDITRSEGPERIAAEWWKRRDSHGATRDYYRVEDTQGRRFWVFRHGLYGSEKASPLWYLHGRFA